MKFKLTILTVVLLAAGCVGVSNLRLNEELTNLYSAQIDARDTNDVILQETIAEAFRSIAQRAEQQARQADETADAISFYRIAATAAWQGRATNVVELADAGWDRCEDVGVSTAPRDCMMLLVIPDLAATDSLTMQLDEVRKKLNEQLSLPPSDRSASILNDLKVDSIKIFDSLQARIAQLRQAESTFGDVSVSDGLKSRMSQNQDFIFCRMRDANGALMGAAGNTNPEFLSRRQEFEQLRQSHDPDNQINCAA